MTKVELLTNIRRLHRTVEDVTFGHGVRMRQLLRASQTAEPMATY